MNDKTRKAVGPMRRFLRREDGTTAIEYGLVTALVSLGLITALSALNNTLSTAYTTIDEELADAAIDDAGG